MSKYVKYVKNMSKYVKILAFQNKRIAVSQLTFRRARNVLGTFEKQAPGGQFRH